MKEVMPMELPSKSHLKKSAKELAEMLKQKYELPVKHSHALEMVSKLFGFRNWNTASALASSSPTPARYSFEAEFLKLLDRRKEIERIWEAEDARGVAVTGYELLLEYEKAFADFVAQFLSARASNLPLTTFKIPPEKRNGKPLRPGEGYIQICEMHINREELLFEADEKFVYLSQQFAFVRDTEIYNDKSDRAGFYGVTWSYDKSGLHVSDDNGPNEPPGNLEGYVEELKSLFEANCAKSAYDFFTDYGFESFKFEWVSESNFVCYFRMKIQDDDSFRANMRKLTEEVARVNFDE